MGVFLTDKKFINDNTKEFAKKIESQYSTFLDKTPTFTDYFHINKVSSTKDTGLQNVEKLTGTTAGTKYNLIKDFPLYGIEQIILELNDDDVHGLDTDYSGEAILVPNTIQPCVDDYFMITAVGKKFFFRVTDFAYDSIKSNNFYRITFTIKAADDTTYYDSFVDQTKETYRTIFRNYGTEDKFIIKEEDYLTIETLDKIYSDISKRYLIAFYNKRFNALMIPDPHGSSNIYDPFVNVFCNRERIFAVEDRNLNNMKFYEEGRAEFEYLYTACSFQSIIINKDLEMLRSEDFKPFYDLISTFGDSIFQYYGDFDTMSVTIQPTDQSVFGGVLFRNVSEELADNIYSNVDNTGNIINDIIVKYMHDDIKMIGKMISEYKGKIPVRRSSYENFITIPIVMYILQKYRAYLYRDNT